MAPFLLTRLDRLRRERQTIVECLSEALRAKLTGIKRRAEKLQRDILEMIFRRGADGKNKLVYGTTNAGKQRNSNEDSYLLLPEKNIYIVADGMGGHNAGRVASLNAVMAVGGYFTPELTAEMKDDCRKIEKEMTNAVMKAHGRLAEISETEEEYSGMGSTIVVSFIHDNMLHTCHVGDSRVYIVNSSGITQTTNDHSTVAELVRLGKMTSEEARYSPLKNEITQALGCSASIKPEYNQHTLNKGDVSLLCSDGLWGMLSDEEIQTIVIEQKTMKGACKKLTRQANAAGGNDNITVVLVQTDGSGIS